MPFDPVNYEGLDRLQHIEKYLAPVADVKVNVKDSQFAGGAKGDGVTDDTAAFQAAATAAIAARGRLVIPTPTSSYKISDTILLQAASGGADFALNVESDSKSGSGIVWAGADSKAVFHSYGWKSSSIRGIKITVPATSTGTVCWDIDTAQTVTTSTSRLSFYDCQNAFTTGSASCVGSRIGHSNNGTGGDASFLNWFNCFVVADVSNGHTGWVWEHANCLNFNWYGGGGYFLSNMATAIPTAGAAGTQGGDSMFFYGVGASHNDADFTFKAPGAYGIYGGRFETGKKFLTTPSGSTSTAIIVAGPDIVNYVPSDNIVFSIGNAAALTLLNVYAKTTTYTSAFITLSCFTGQGLLRIIGGGIQGADPPFTIGAGTWDVYIEGVGLLNSSLQPTTYFVNTLSGVKALTYSASMTPNAALAPWQTVTVTDGTAMTVNAPTNPPASNRTKNLTVEFLNSSGGAMGVVTWNAAFILVAGAFTNPANTKKRYITFSWNGANWVETSRASTDY